MEEEQEIKVRLVKNSFWNFLSMSITRLGALVFTILLARFLMPENYGIYVLVLSTIMIFYTLANLGINQTLVRYLSYSLKNNKEKIPSYYSYLLKMKLGLSIISSIALLALAYPISHYVFKNPKLFMPFLVGAFYILILSLEGFYSKIFYAIEKVKYLSIKSSISQILRIIFALLVFYLVASSYQVVGIYMSLILVTLFLIIFNLFYLKKLIPDLYKKPKQEIDKKSLWRFVGFLTIANISTVFFSHVDTLMLGLFVSSEYVGYYGAAFSLILGVIGIVSFPNALLLPLFTKMKKSKIDHAFNTTFKYLSIITLPAIFGMLALGNYFIVAFFGYAYVPSTLPFYFLSFLIFPVVTIGMFLALFSAEEKPEIFAKLIGIACVINIVLNFILIKALLQISPKWAITGAAIATLATWAFYFISANYTIKKEFNLHVSFNLVSKPLFASLAMFGILYYTLSLVKDMNLFIGIGEIFLGIIIYFVVLFLIGGITKKDISLLKLILKKEK